MLDYSIPIGGLNIKSGSLYGATEKKASFKLKNSVLKIDTPKTGVLADALNKDKSAGSLAKNFETTLLSHLVKANNKVGEKKHTDEENEALVGSVVSLVKEVSDEFGDSEANRLMAKILVNTEGGVTENRVVAALGEFFKNIKSTNLGIIANPLSATETGQNANEVLEKLDKIVTFLNDGPNIDEEDGASVLSVANLLNSYFAPDRVNEEDKKKFTIDFDYLSEKEQKEDQEAKVQLQEQLEFVLTKAELGAENVALTVQYLSENLDSEEAAALVGDLDEEADIFAAVEKVRSYLEKLDSEDKAKAQSQETASAATSTLASQGSLNKLVSEVVTGAGKKALFDGFLNSFLVNQIDRIVKEDEKVGSRVSAQLSSKVGYEVGIGNFTLVGWPGTGVVSGAGVSVSIGFQSEVSLSVTEDNKIESSISQTVKISASFVSGTFTTSPLGLASGL
ncbi:MAG: hypothetical protein LBE38_11130, partial [Deltaproteobacteria bacterium]|nr:hypothetical protein [Deltaproteobacteria bacterium]